MALPVKTKLTIVTITYWFLLLYIIAALVWWFIALQKQNNLMANMLLVEIKKTDSSFTTKTNLIEQARSRKNAQYLGEGITFLALILVGAVFVFRATRKQIKLQTQQQNFMMAITHELKTPIAVAQLNLETLQKRQLEQEKQQKLITNTLQETSRLNSLCNNILLASQLDANGFANNTLQEIAFTDLVHNCMQAFTNRFPLKQVHSHINEGIYINGDELLLQMLVNNLLDNANKYSAKQTTIHVTLYQQQQTIYLHIADEGIGINDDEKKRIFDKFYRTGNENTRNTKGTGLGLYLCKKIVSYCNGQLTVANNTPQGSIFTATFTATHEQV